MQKIIATLAFAAVITLTSCGTSRASMNTQNVQVEKLQRGDYSLLNKTVDVTVKKNTFWVLFLPFGMQSEERLKQRAYTKAVKSVTGASGILNPKYDYNKWSIPLIVFTFTHKTLNVTGEAFRMRSDAELEAEKNKAAKAAKN
jgi:hypothetical protein